MDRTALTTLLIIEEFHYYPFSNTFKEIKKTKKQLPHLSIKTFLPTEKHICVFLQSLVLRTWTQELMWTPARLR